ncbi:MAG: hypothetical protein EOM19_01655 [Candidatus Moranbacteria bacterium]|nr:hypothetical protein [Candidatus Moranbacteria bacterium]
MFGTKINTNKNSQKDEEERYSPFEKESIKSSTIKTMAKDRLLLEKSNTQVFSNEKKLNQNIFSKKEGINQEESPFFLEDEEGSKKSFQEGANKQDKKNDAFEEGKNSFLEINEKMDVRKEMPERDGMSFDKDDDILNGKIFSEKKEISAPHQGVFLQEKDGEKVHVGKESFNKDSLQNSYTSVSEGALALERKNTSLNKEDVTVVLKDETGKENFVEINSFPFSLKKMIGFFGGVLVFSFLLGGGYYLEKTYDFISWLGVKKENEPPILIPLEPINPPEEKEPIIESKYLSDEVNIISLREEEDISLKIEEIRDELDINPQTSKIFTFSFVSEENAPLLFGEVFPNFSTSTKNAFSVSSWLLLATFDGGATKFGLIGKISSEVKAKEIFRTNEIRTKEFFSLLYPEEVTFSNNLVSFSDSVYQQKAIRYWNIDTISTYSFDYTLFEKYFLIGTSKDSMRVFLDSMVEIESFIEESLLVSEFSL